MPRQDPREDVAAPAGQGGFGNDFNPNDKEYQTARMKARGVLEGRAKFTRDELQRLVARFLIGR